MVTYPCFHNYKAKRMIFKAKKKVGDEKFVSVRIAKELTRDIARVEKSEHTTRSEAIRGLIKLGLIHYFKGVNEADVSSIMADTLKESYTEDITNEDTNEY